MSDFKDLKLFSSELTIDHRLNQMMMHDILIEQGTINQLNFKIENTRDLF